MKLLSRPDKKINQVIQTSTFFFFVHFNLICMLPKKTRL